MKSQIVFSNGKQVLKTDRGETPFCAYVTYYTENARYEDFESAGYHLYSVCCYFTSMPINSRSGFTPCRKNGIFDVKGSPDFSEFDEDVADLLEKDPKALFFPRIYLSMPAWWVEENPGETVPTVANPEGREMLFSDKFRSDGADMLREFMRHVENSSYRENLVGYQISGGSTQEWFHFDYNGSFCENAYPYFCRYMEEKGEKKPEKQAFLAGEYKLDYDAFANESVADVLEYFCSACKKECDGRLIVGAFYGYALENHDLYNSGGFAMNRLIDSKNIDFFCSPFSYSDGRTLDRDLSYMVPYGSTKLHGKAYIIEADVRTFLTKYPDESRENIRIKTLYRGASIWLGEKTEYKSMLQLRRAAAKVLTGSAALWWFDMWGGWYASDGLMSEMARIRRLFDYKTGDELPSVSRAAIIIDEHIWGRYPNTPENFVREFCKLSYLSGVVSDVYLTYDVEKIADDYDVFLFPQPDPDNKILDFLRSHGKTTAFGKDMTVEDILSACKTAGVSPLCEAGDIVYEGNGIICYHAVKNREKTITLPVGYTAEKFYNADDSVIEDNVIRANVALSDTAFFRIVKK